jgi:hypothetical protein
MPLPDPHADEPGYEVPEDLWEERNKYLTYAAQWKKMADEITARIQQEMGSATAVLVAGQKVATYRPSRRYAESQLQRDHPNLTQHYRHEVRTDVFDMELFAKAHPDIADQYVIRSFRVVSE